MSEDMLYLNLPDDVVITIGGIKELSTIDSDGLAVAIYFQGCKRRCKGCHNPELQKFGVGERRMASRIVAFLEKYAEDYDNVVLVGGEPLEQPDAVRYIALAANVLGIGVWLYTGYNEEEIPEDIKELCTVIVAGEYVEELATGGFPASSNQVVIDKRGKRMIEN